MLYTDYSETIVLDIAYNKLWGLKNEEYADKICWPKLNTNNT